MSADGKSPLDLAEKVARVLDGLGVPSVLIGAAAMAAHGYVRMTDDIDLGTAVDPFQVVPPVHRALLARGFAATLRQPDDDDPLGGVIRIDAAEGPGLAVVNFLNPARRGAERVMQEALREAAPVEPGSALRVLPLTHLVALKLHAGGRFSQADVAALLDANPQVNIAALRTFLARFGLGAELDEALRMRRP